MGGNGANQYHFICISTERLFKNGWKSMIQRTEVRKRQIWKTVRAGNEPLLVEEMKGDTDEPKQF